MDPLTMLRFNRAVRKALFERLATLPEGEFTRNAEISFHSIRDTLFHVIRVEDFWVNGFLGPGHRMVSRGALDGVASVGDLAELWNLVSDRTEKFMRDLSPERLREVRKRPIGDRAVQKTVEEYLFTFLIHEVYHKGEVLAVLWQADVEPPPVDYWRY